MAKNKAVITDRASAREIREIGADVLADVYGALVALGAVSEDRAEVLAGAFMPYEITDHHRSGLARKYVSGRTNADGVNEIITYSVQVTQGGQTGRADLVTIVGTFERSTARGPITMSASAADYMARTDYADYGITGEPVRAMAGVVGRLQDLDADAIARALVECRAQDATAPYGAPVATIVAHAFDATEWTHRPTGGRVWKNTGANAKRGKTVTRH